MPFIVGLICVLLAPFVLLLVVPINLLKHMRDRKKQGEKEDGE